MNTLSRWGRGNEKGCEAAILYAIARNKIFTSHELARKTGYTPQHINRTLKKMWAFGKVAYYIVGHRKNSNKRMWANVEYARMIDGVYPFEFAMRKLL